MNMRTPKYLRERDPIYASLPQVEEVIDLTQEDSGWTAEELENVDRQVEQVLLEEAFIEACFEEMLMEEEAEWHHYDNQPQPNVYLDTGIYYMFTEQTYIEPCYLQWRNKLNPRKAASIRERVKNQLEEWLKTTNFADNYYIANRKLKITRNKGFSGNIQEEMLEFVLFTDSWAVYEATVV